MKTMMQANKAKKMMKRVFLVLSAFLVLPAVAAWSAQEPFVSETMNPGRPDIAVQPESITIGTTYTGTTLDVSGRVPEDCDVVAVMSGERKELHLKEKGKALGLLWMNMGSLTYTGVPDVFFISSGKKIEDMKGEGPEDEMSVGQIGFDGLKKSITVESEKPDTERYVEELFKLKKKDGLYEEQIGHVTYSGAASGAKDFHALIRVPSRLSPEKYEVHVYAVKDGRIVSESEKPIEAKLAGVPLFLANLAFGHSLLYGVLSTLIAIVGGLVIGFVFQGSKEGSH